MPEKKSMLESLWEANSGHKVSVILPRYGNRKKMTDLILKNIELIQSQGSEPGLVELKEILKLESIPKTIECFDISNHGEDYAIGSMSQFVDGAPNKSGYRKFKIKTVKGRDDFAMIAEVVKRRYIRLINEGLKMPDLVLIDGGKGQLSAATKSLQSLSLKIPCVSLAKENEEVFTTRKKESIKIPKKEASLKILQYARDEAHRFGVRYNRKLREIQK